MASAAPAASVLINMEFLQTCGREAAPCAVKPWSALKVHSLAVAAALLSQRHPDGVVTKGC
jgi:hypothetical protein